MRSVAVPLGLVSALACSFPAYVPLPSGNGGSAGANGDGGAPNSSGSSGTGNMPAPACDDGKRNGEETDVDCGFAAQCGACDVGQRCLSEMDCDGGACVRFECAAPSCRDGLLNGNETDVDCGGGGDCTPCQLGQACQVTADCDALSCDDGQCQPAGCSDGIKNGDETDLDCGGSCVANPCDDALKCKIADDCKSGVCSKQTLTCAAPTCDDGVLNGDEPTQDCGASCDEKCRQLDACYEAADCESAYCKDDLCLPSAPTWEALSPVGWVASASHTSMNSDPQDVIDGIESTYWNTGTQQVPGMWFEIDMGEPQVFFTIEVVCTVERDDSAAALDVWLSNDGAFAEKAQSNLPGEDIFNIIFDEPQVARYIRLSLAQGTNRWWAIDEIRVKQ